VKLDRVRRSHFVFRKESLFKQEGSRSLYKRRRCTRGVVVQVEKTMNKGPSDSNSAERPRAFDADGDAEFLYAQTRGLVEAASLSI